MSSVKSSNLFLFHFASLWTRCCRKCSCMWWSGFLTTRNNKLLLYIYYPSQILGRALLNADDLKNGLYMKPFRKVGAAVNGRSQCKLGTGMVQLSPAQLLKLVLWNWCLVEIGVELIATQYPLLDQFVSDLQNLEMPKLINIGNCWLLSLLQMQSLALNFLSAIQAKFE